jgi:hypothetical protein
MKKYVAIILLFILSLSAKAPVYTEEIASIVKASVEKRAIEIRLVLMKEHYVEKLMFIIRLIESNNNYTSIGSSGEYGAYQFMPKTWQLWSNMYFDETLNIIIPENQDKVAKARIYDLLDRDYTYKEIAAIWNSGSPRWKGRSGVNMFGVYYNVESYVNKFDTQYKLLTLKID